MNFKHGNARKIQTSPEYLTWSRMIGRCYNFKNVKYENYGGRGIFVCKRWRDDFKNFLEDMGKRPIGKSLDRINNDGNYEPGNCRWATPKEQANNRRIRKDLIILKTEEIITARKNGLNWGQIAELLKVDRKSLWRLRKKITLEVCG